MALSRHDLHHLKAELTEHLQQLQASEKTLLAVLLRLRQEAESFQQELGQVEARIHLIQEDLQAIDDALAHR